LPSRTSSICIAFRSSSSCPSSPQRLTIPHHTAAHDPRAPGLVHGGAASPRDELTSTPAPYTHGSSRSSVPRLRRGLSSDSVCTCHQVKCLCTAVQTHVRQHGIASARVWWRPARSTVRNCPHYACSLVFKIIPPPSVHGMAGLRSA
jgi:hypothetical protein